MRVTSEETPEVGTPNTTSTSAASPYLTTAEACDYLRFTGADRLNSLYRFLEAHGVPKRYRSARRLLVSRADLDAALAGRTAARRRNAIKRATRRAEGDLS
jgi:hypothetical protein